MVCAYRADNGHDGHTEYLREQGMAVQKNYWLNGWPEEQMSLNNFLVGLKTEIHDASACNQFV